MEISQYIPNKPTFQREEIIQILDNFRFLPKDHVSETPLTLDEIREVVEFVFGANIIADTRRRKKVNALKAFSYLAKEYTNLPYEVIGKYVNRDHATILHHSNPKKDSSCQSLMQVDKKFRKLVETCEEILKSKSN